MTPDQKAIVAAAVQNGIDPSWALAVAERESNFDPRARSSETIRGAYQMTAALRNKYGIGDSDDIGEQTAGWGRFFADNKREMAGVLGRDPTDEEGYLGHYVGGTRAARMLRMGPATPVDQVFTPQELAVNPNFARAGTVGQLNSSILGDMKARHAKYAEQIPDLSGDADGAPDKPDFASFGTPVEQPKEVMPSATANQPTAMRPASAKSAPADAPDFSQFGTIAS